MHSIDVGEIYSPERVTTVASRMRLIPGLALDLTTVDPEDGEPWDFDKLVKRKMDDQHGEAQEVGAQA